MTVNIVDELALATEKLSINWKEKKDQTIELIDDYFLNRGRKPKKSKNISKKIIIPDPSQFCNQLSIIYNQSIPDYSSEFLEWDCLLKNDFNILLYGFGTKIPIMKSFIQKYSQENHIEIHGYDSKASIKKIKVNIQNAKENSMIFIHNIDGTLFRSPSIQNYFAELAKSYKIIASIDHVNFPSLWSDTVISKFNWVFKHVPSHISYHKNETTFDNNDLICNLITGKSIKFDSEKGNEVVTGTIACLHQVMNSVNQNAKNIFHLIVSKSYEIKNNCVSKTCENGISLEELYWFSRDECLSSNEVTFKSQLNEFRDHKMLKITKNRDGKEMIQCLLEKDAVREIIENFDNF